MITRGVILCGGAGTRLRPFTDYFSKSLYPIGDKFVVDYPIATLVSLGVKELVVILGDKHFDQITAYLKDGSSFGMRIVYIFQPIADGVASGINLARDVIGDNDFYAILGDNIFLGTLSLSCIGEKGCGIVLRQHDELERFGVASIDRDGIAKIQEKPKKDELPIALTHYAITGLYKFDGCYWDYFSRLEKSQRGEYEIAHIIDHYHNDDNLGFVITNVFWQDTGTISGIDKVRQYINGTA